MRGSINAQLTPSLALRVRPSRTGLGDAEADQEKVNYTTALALVKVFQGKPLTRSDAVAISSTVITAIAIAAGAAAPVTLFLGAAVVATEAITQAYIAAYNEIFPDKPKIIDTSCSPENIPRNENDPRWHFLGRNHGINKGTVYQPGTFDAFAGPLLRLAWEGNWNCRAAVPVGPLLLVLVDMWNKTHGGPMPATPPGKVPLAVPVGPVPGAPFYIRKVYEGSGNPDFDGNYDNPVTASISALSSMQLPAQIVLRSGPYVKGSNGLPPGVKVPPGATSTPIGGGMQTGGASSTGLSTTAIVIGVPVLAVGGVATYAYFTRQTYLAALKTLWNKSGGRVVKKVSGRR